MEATVNSREVWLDNIVTGVKRNGVRSYYAGKKDYSQDGYGSKFLIRVSES